MRAKQLASAVKGFLAMNETMCRQRLEEMNENPDFDPVERPAAYWRGMLACGRGLSTILEAAGF